MITFPSILPSAIQNNYSYNHIDNLLVSQLMNGRQKQRRKFFSTPTIVNVQWIFKYGELQIFEAWYAYDVKDGQEWFEVPILTAKVLNVTECRFRKMYTITLRDQYWFVSAELETRTRNLLTEEEFRLFPEFFMDSDIIDLGVNREFPKI